MRMFVVLLVIGMGRDARAQEATRTESYRGTIGVLDGVSLGLAIPGAIAISEGEGATRTLGIVATSVGSALFVFGAPLAHNAKQRTKDKYYGSMLLRVLGVGLIGGAGAKLGETQCPEDDKNCGKIGKGFVVAASIGAVAVSAFDLAVLARRQVAVVPTNGGAMVGIGGRF
jgi:hypothetical protein